MGGSEKSGSIFNYPLSVHDYRTHNELPPTNDWSVQAPKEFVSNKAGPYDLSGFNEVDSWGKRRIISA